MAEATQSSTEQRSSSGERSSSEATRSSDIAHDQSREGHGGKHTHHGRTPAAWAGSITALVGFLIGGFAVVAQNWTLFWIAVGICAVALIITVVLQKMGYGAD
jgi:hypothetical protein